MKIPCTIINALAPCVDDKSGRYVLNGIHIEEGPHPYAIASDGSHLIVASWSNNDVATHLGAVTLDTNDLVDAAARAKQIHQLRDITLTAQAATLVHAVHGPSSTSVAKLDGKYPKWRECIPKAPRSVSVRVDAKRLAIVARAVGRALADPDHPSNPVELLIPLDENGEADDSGPIVLSGHRADGRKVMGMLMTLKSTDRPADTPVPVGWNPKEDEEDDTPAEPEGES